MDLVLILVLLVVLGGGRYYVASRPTYAPQEQERLIRGEGVIPISISGSEALRASNAVWPVLGCQDHADLQAKTGTEQAQGEGLRSGAPPTSAT